MIETMTVKNPMVMLTGVGMIATRDMDRGRGGDTRQLASGSTSVEKESSKVHEEG